MAARVRDRQERDAELRVRSMEMTERREPLEFPADSELCRALQKAGQFLGLTLPLGGAVSFGDTADWKDEVGLKAACLFGPGETRQAHAADEHVRVADLVAAARIYGLAIAYLCGAR